MLDPEPRGRLSKGCMMSRFDRFKSLTDALTRSRHPKSLQVLADELDCAPVTVKRLVRDLRERQRMPIRYDREARGYLLERTPGETTSLKLTESELYALLLAEQLLATAQPGELASELGPLRAGIQTVLARAGAITGALNQRFRVRPHARRPLPSAIFQTVADALLSARMLSIHYLARSSNATSRRNVAPWRLEFYRDNWYLHAWCNLRSAWRRFALDRIRQPTVLIDSAHWPQPPPDEPGYGLFAAGTVHTAQLKFGATRARWIADEQWHPAQRITRHADGTLTLDVPYTDATELVLDILRYGDDVEVIAPASLREMARSKLQAALAQYPPR